jgi:hypothetical protein
MGCMRWFGQEKTEVEFYTLSHPFYDVMQADGQTVAQEGHARLRGNSLSFEDHNGRVLFAYAPGQWIKCVRVLDSKMEKAAK